MWLIKRIHTLSDFLAFYTKEVLIANLRIARDVLSPGLRVTPGFFMISLRTEADIELLAFANLVTMTPGTMSVDVSPDKKTLLVHAMYTNDLEELKRSLGDKFQDRVLEVFRWSR